MFELVKKPNTQGRSSRWADHIHYSPRFSKMLISGCRALGSGLKHTQNNFFSIQLGMGYGVHIITARVFRVFFLLRWTLLDSSSSIYRPIYFKKVDFDQNFSKWWDHFLYSGRIVRIIDRPGLRVSHTQNLKNWEPSSPPHTHLC